MKKEDIMDISEATCTRYSKIIRMNLTEDSYDILQANDAVPDGATYKLSVWFQKAIESDLIFEADREQFAHFVKLDNMIEFAESDQKYASIHYRRKDGDKYRWSVMDIVKLNRCDTDNHVVMAFVRDVHNDYGHEWEYLEALEQLSSYDTTTGLQSRTSYNRIIRQLEQSDKPAGVIFCDINALKYVNDNIGHTAGDMYLKEFADTLCSVVGKRNCYRISGDEFVAVLENIESVQALEVMAIELRKKKSSFTECPIASVGEAYSFSGGIRSLIKMAEKSMYDNKKMFYVEYPQLKR